MKKLLVFTILISLFAMLSCTINTTEIVAINNSSYAVSFKLNGTAVSLEPKQTYSYTNGSDMIFNSPDAGSISPKRVVSRRIDRYSFELVDVTPIDVRVSNSFSEPVTLVADGYFNTDPMDVPSGDNGGAGFSNTIYTSNPAFKVISDIFPGKADFEIRSDGIMYVTIH